jgi:hypothetical protein
MKFEGNREISSQLALSIVFVLSFFVAWFTISAGESMLKTAKKSEAFNLDMRMKMLEAQKTKSAIKTAPRN